MIDSTTALAASHIVCQSTCTSSLYNWDWVEQQPPLVAAVVVRRQLERGVAFERVARLLLRVLDEEVGGRADLLPRRRHAEELDLGCHQPQNTKTRKHRASQPRSKHKNTKTRKHTQGDD